MYSSFTYVQETGGHSEKGVKRGKKLDDRFFNATPVYTFLAVTTEDFPRFIACGENYG